MQLQCEKPEKNAIQSYKQNQIYINHQCYTESLLVDQTEIHILPNLNKVIEIDPTTCLMPLSNQPEILLIGHTDAPQMLTPNQFVLFTQAKIGVECMNLEAACRTFNMLLGEDRKVCLLLIRP